MENTFKSFCAFGAGKNAQAQMDNAKFAKLFRDLKLLNKTCTSTDVDITFSKVKAKTDRKINFKQFKEAIAILAPLIHPGDSKDEAYSKVEQVITNGKIDKSKIVKATNVGGVDRLTDTSKYTGTHKERFDESGKGKGLDGRRDMDSKAEAGYVGGYKMKDTYDATH